MATQSLENEKTYREADEIFVYMGKDFRVSRNARAHWFFDHINKNVEVEELDFKNEKDKEMAVVGVVPKDGTATEVLIGQEFRVTTETKVVYISRYYRQVYVLELSPSIIVADDETDCCLYNKLIECLRTSLESVTKPFTIPGSHSVYEPHIYASVIIFVPFLAFEEDLTIVSGVLLTHRNVEAVLTEVDRKWKMIKTRLYRFSQSVMRKWALIRRRHKNRLDSTCANESFSTVSSEETTGEKTSSWIKGGLFEVVPDYVIPLSDSINAVPKRVFDSTVSGKKRKSTRVEARGEGYIIPELALMFMLRLGLTVVQTMPENTQSNVIIITDGVSGMPAPESLQTILRELRGYTVACSFIEVKGKPICAPCFGHVTSGDLFHFLATATFGGYLPNCLCTVAKRDPSLPEKFLPLNSFHRALLCWSFQSALQENKHIFESIKAINPGFAELYQQNTDYHVMINTTYTSTLKELLYVRLREGFTVKSVELQDARIQINLSLPFRPLIVLEYGINAPWPVTDEKGPVHVDLVAAGPQDEIRDMKLSKSSECVYRANAMRMHLINSLEDCCRRIAFADRIMLHLHSFNLNSYFYSYPKGINQIPLYFKSYVTLKNGEQSDSILVPKFTPRENKEGFSSFLRFWHEVVNLRQDEWQKWVHVHIERAVLYCQPFGNICVQRNHHEKVSCQKAKDAFHQFLLDMNSFCLIEEELYVMFVAKREDGVPSYFYMLRVEQTLPYVVMKCAFLGGICSSERRRVVKELRIGLAKLKFRPRDGPDEPEEFVLTTMKRPLERILITYDNAPDNNYLAQWTNTESEEDIFEIPLAVENEKHNAITKYLEGRRHVWHLPLKISDDLRLDPVDYQRVSKMADSFVNGLLKRRLQEGFLVAWTKNMIIGLVRQIEVEGRTMLQQYIIFQPSCCESLIGPQNRKTIPRQGFLVSTESWNEPCLFGTTPCSTSKRADEDDDYIVCHYTLKYLLLLTSETVCGPTTVAQEVAQVKNGFYLFPRISYIQNPFNIHTLLKHSRRLLLHLPTFEIGDDPSGELRNAVFSTAFFSEFGRYSNVYFDVHDPKVFAMLLTRMYADKKEKKTFNAEQFKRHGFDDRYCCKSRIYVKELDLKNCLIMVVPAEDRISEDRRSWPVIVAIGDAILTQDCMAIGASQNRVLEHRMKRMRMSRSEDMTSPAEDDLSVGEVERPDINRENPMGMREIVGEVRDAILERATVSALFKCLKLGKGSSLDKEDVSWILDETCDYTNVELYCVPESMETFCEHLKKDQPRQDTDHCDPSTLQAIFDSVLKFKNFTPIPTDPNYYYYNAEDPVPRELIRRNSLLVEVVEPSLVLLNPGGRPPTFPVRFRPGSKGKSPKHKQLGDAPLFIFFHCVLQLPNGEEEYVPVNYLPSCANQVLQSAQKNVPVKDLHKVRVKLLVYVLTMPRQMKDDVDEGTETNPTDFIGRAKKFLSKLPFAERDAVRETISWMNRSLRLECLLVSEKLVDQTSIETVSDFITDIVGKTYCDFSKDNNDKNFLASQVRQRFRSLKFVVPSTNAFETLMNRLDGKAVEYCTLRRIEDSKYFYIHRAENKKGFERHIKDHYLRKIRGEEKQKRPRHDSSTTRSLSRTESESSVFSSSPRMDQTPEMEQALEKAREVASTFWVILSIEKTVSPTDYEEIMVKLQFCERYACEPSQHKIYDKTWMETRAEIRKINQEILLEDMFYTRTCSQFLLTKEDKKDYAFNQEKEEEEDSCLDQNMANTAQYDFAPGSLACPLVWDFWVKIHPRMRRKTKYGQLHDVAVLLRRSFEQYMVVNVPNTFVFRGEDGYILYGQFYPNYEQFLKSGKTYNMDFELIADSIREKFGDDETLLLFAGFGVSKPPDSLKALIGEGLIERKLNEHALDGIVDIYKRNPRALVEPYDVEFIQADVRKPAIMFFYSIPTIMKKYTAAILHYLGQHLAFNGFTDARTRDILKSGSQVPAPVLPTFKSYPAIVIPGEPSNSKYEPSFLMYNKFKEKGSKDFGISVIETRLINERGVIAKPTNGLLRLDSHKNMIPNVDDPNTMYEWFETITTTHCEQVDPKLQPGQQPKAPTPVPNSCAYMQVIVWQIGDVGLSQLEQIAKIAVENSFLDVVTEYGILNTDIIEASTPLFPPPSPSGLTPTKLKTPISSQKLSSAKKRDSTETAHQSGMQTPTPLTAEAKRGSTVFTYEPIRRGSNHEVLPRDDFVLPLNRVPEHLSNHFKKCTDLWFEFTTMKAYGIHSMTYRKTEFKLRHSVLVQQTLNQIEHHIRHWVENEHSALNDRIQIFQNVNRGTNDQPRYDLVNLPLVDEKATDIPPKEHHPRYILLSYADDINRETRRYGYENAKDLTEPPTALVKLAASQKDCKWLYLPNVYGTFTPRQTMLIIKVQNNTLTMFTYNFLPLLHEQIVNTVYRIVMWQNAKYRLYEHIVEHPLDPVLPPVPEDWRSVDNSYVTLIGLNPDLLLEVNAPLSNLSGMGVPISSEIAQRLFRVRRSYTAQVAHACPVQRAFQQFKEMRKEVKQQVYAYQSNKIMYDNLIDENYEVPEEQLQTMWGHCRRVHYVQTPVLLSPAWRRKIAQVRRGVNETPAKPKQMTVSHLTSISRSRAGTLSGALTRQQTLPTKTKEEEELYDPCHVKMLHDLTIQYAEFLGETLQLNLLNVIMLSEKSQEQHRYKMEYPQGGRKPPDVCLFKRLMHGILLVRLHFVPPYFIMSVGMWAAPELLLRDQTLTERESKEYLSRLEFAKDQVVSKSHMHSFTYDFHLRMISRYLIHKAVLFPNGYNISTFLMDFLKYYACRPPSARNCVYEERTVFNLHKNVNSSSVWTCFLDKNYEEKYRWKVLRIRVTDEETDSRDNESSRANEYMLASCVESSLPNSYSKVCVLLRDRRKKEADGSIGLAQYMILVDEVRNRPLEEARQREDSSKSNVGEFRSVPLAPTEEQLNKEVNDMMALVLEGGMPTVEGMVTRRRRFSSGSHTPPGQSGETESGMHSPVLLHGSESDTNVPVQGDPTLRHRKHNAGSNDEAEIPGEKANYIQYISNAQRKLQLLLEDTANEYSDIIKLAVDQANRECLREFLWCSVCKIPSSPLIVSRLGSQVRLGTSQEIWNSLRTNQHQDGQHIIELCDLVERENMKDREQRLRDLVGTANCARLCRFLVYYFKPVRCRVFESPQLKTSNRSDVSPDLISGQPVLRHLLIINPDNQILFLVRCEEETNPDLLILFKKDISGLKPHFTSLLDKAFDEFVQSVTAFIWSDLIYRPPGKST